MIKPIFNNVKADCKKFLDKTQVILQTKLSLKDKEIKKVLSTACEADITSCECLNGSAVFLGRANFKMLAENSESKLESLNYNADFSDKFENAAVTPSAKLTFSAEVIDVEIEEVRGSDVSVNAVFEITVYQTEETELSCLVGGESFFTRTNEVQTACVVSRFQAEFENVYEGNFKSDAGKVLMAESCVDVQSITPQFDSVLLEGSTFTYLTTCDDENGVFTEIYEIPFKEEVEAKGVTPESAVQGSAKAKSTKVRLNFEENNTIGILVSVRVDGTAVAKRTCSCVNDAYSLANELNFSGQSLESTFVTGHATAAAKMNGSVTIAEDFLPSERKLHVVNPKVVIVNAKPYDGKVEAEGIFTGSAVYKLGEALTSVFLESPFTEVLTAESVVPNSICAVHAVVSDVNCEKSNNGTIEVDAALRFSVDVSENSVDFVLTEIEEGEPKAENKTAIEVFVGRKDATLWDVSKNLNLSEAEILAYNPDLETPLRGGEKIVVYRRAKI